MKFKEQFLIILVGCMFVLSGCYSAIDNQTPRTIPQNPSNSYKIAMKVNKSNINILPDSYESRLIADGVVYNMIKTRNLEFYFDYKIKDENKHVIDYYYEVDYQIKKQKKTIKSKSFKLNIINRYVVGFECNRGRPYSEVSLLGRGFVEGDRIIIGGYVCDTKFVSPNVLTFTIPLIDGGKYYKAILDSENGDIGLGEFFVDALEISAAPNPIKLHRGDKQVLILSINIDAPEVGLPLDITTDIPDSIIMHDVSIHPGMRSARVIIEGGIAGEGSLFICAPGFADCIIPVTIIDDFPENENIDDFSYSNLTDLESDIFSEE